MKNHATTIWKTTRRAATTRPPLSAPRTVRALPATTSPMRTPKIAIAQAVAPLPIAKAAMATMSEGPSPHASFDQKRRARSLRVSNSPSAIARSLHALGRVDPDEVETARDHGLRRAAEREPERLLLALEHAVLVVEAVEVVGDADRVLRDPLRPALLRRVGDDRREARRAA